jgi:hypothetical protein
MVILVVPLRANASKNPRVGKIINAKRSSRGRILYGLGVVDMNLMIVEIKNIVFRMKFISHQRYRDFGCVVALNFFSCPIYCPKYNP